MVYGCVVGGGIVLRCDVFVDTISRIEITTRTRELLLEEEPERFELQAFDDEGEGVWLVDQNSTIILLFREYVQYSEWTCLGLDFSSRRGGYSPAGRT